MSSPQPRRQSHGRHYCRAHITLPLDTRAIADARDFVRVTLRSWGSGIGTHINFDDVVLVVSELVTNAILHANSGPDLSMTWSDGNLRIEVVDNSSTPPHRQEASIEATSGRGVKLVEALATSWGSQPEPADGKIVWCEFGESD